MRDGADHRDQMSDVKKGLLPGQLIWLWLTGVVIALDQITKHMVVARFDLYERLEVMPFFNLTREPRSASWRMPGGGSAGSLPLSPWALRW